MDTLRTEQHPRWRVSIDDLVVGNSSENMGARVGEIKTWLDTLDKTGGTKLFKWGDWSARVTALDSPGASSLFFLKSGGGEVNHFAILNRILEKESRYGPMDAPYLIAILVSDPTKGFEYLVTTALFGYETIQMGKHSRAGGAFERLPHLSGVVVADMLHAGSIENIVPMVWINPWATRLLPSLDPIPWSATFVQDELLTSIERPREDVVRFLSE